MPAITPDFAQTEAAIVEMTNTFRARENLAPLKSDPVLRAAAHAFAQYLAKTNSFSHTADGKSPSQRADAAGYKSCRLAENLALHRHSEGFTPWMLAQNAVEGWINSAGHRANLLTAGATDVAVAIAKIPDAHPKFVAVQLIASPQSRALRFSIINNAAQTVSYRFGSKSGSIKPAMRINHTACEGGVLSIDNLAQGTFTPESGALYAIDESASGALTMTTTLNAAPR